MIFQRRPSSPEGKTAASTAARALLALGICAYVGFYLYWTLNNLANFGMFGFDFGIHDQAVWLFSHGHWNPFITISGTHYFADHLSWIMYVLVPFYWLFGSSKVLLVAQAVLLGSAAIPLFLVVRHKLGSEWLACGLGLAYLLNPYIGWANMDQFHPDVFEVVLVFLLFLFIMRRRWWWLLVVALLLMLVKEDAALLVFGAGLWAAYYFDRIRGLVMAFVSAIWLYVNFRFLLPLLSGTGSLAEYLVMHANRVPFGGVAGFLRTVFTKPWKVVAAGFGEGRPLYYLQVLLPTAAMPFLSPSTFIAVILPLLANALSTFYYQHSISYHYGTLVVPGLFLATVFGIAHGSPKVRKIMVAVVLVTTVFSVWLWGPLPGSRHPAVWAQTAPQFASAVHEAIALIPKEAVVSVEYHLLTQLDHRELIYEFPNPWTQLNWNSRETKQQLAARATGVEYVLLTDTLEGDSLTLANKLYASGDFAIIYDQQGVVLMHRIRVSAAGG